MNPINDDIPRNLKVLADLDKISHVFRNLISNALKFTPRDGSVTISISVVNNTFLRAPVSWMTHLNYLSLPSYNKMIRFDILDTGVGISQVHRHGIFRVICLDAFGSN